MGANPIPKHKWAANYAAIWMLSFVAFAIMYGIAKEWDYSSFRGGVLQFYMLAGASAGGAWLLCYVVGLLVSGVSFLFVRPEVAVKGDYWIRALVIAWLVAMPVLLVTKPH